MRLGSDQSGGGEDKGSLHDVFEYLAICILNFTLKASVFWPTFELVATLKHAPMCGIYAH